MLYCPPIKTSIFLEGAKAAAAASYAKPDPDERRPAPYWEGYFCMREYAAQDSFYDVDLERIKIGKEKQK